MPPIRVVRESVAASSSLGCTLDRVIMEVSIILGIIKEYRVGVHYMKTTDEPRLVYGNTRKKID